MSMNPAASGGISVMHFLVKKKRIRTKRWNNTRNENKTNNDYIWISQKVERWKTDFYFWKTPDNRPTALFFYKDNFVRTKALILGKK